jgi:hypothetical protein
LHAKTFLSNARAQLDADHFGLEKIKKRLIEYLAVVRLKEMNAERELAVERQKEKDKDAAQGKSAAVDGMLEDGGKKDIDTQPPQQLQFGIPSAIPGKPQHQGRLGKKGVKGPILLYVPPSSHPPSPPSLTSTRPSFHANTVLSVLQALARHPLDNPSHVPSTGLSNVYPSVASVTKLKSGGTAARTLLVGPGWWCRL